MPEDKMGLDIGPKTEKLFASALDGAKSILWNGPMGVFENKLFASGTVAVGSAVVQSTAAGATSVIGGGDTAAAVRQFGFAEKVSYVSTGGGASLEYCEGKKLPGMAPLEVNSALKKIYLYGNWKMNMTRGETDAFMKALAAAFASSPELAAANGKTLEIAVFPPFTSIAAATDANGAALVNVGAQNVYFEPKGAFTGEISIPMLKDAGCTRVILGHSERRHIFGESDELIAKKVKTVLDAGLIPVLCYGETLEEREAGRTAEVVTRQLRTALTGLSSEALEKIVYAYEPVWAIGTGKSATSAEAQEVCADSKKLLAELAGKPISVVVLYGGSVNADNAKELLSMSAIDGALVGGASLKVDSFLQIYVRGAA
jgi:triosephosphate isomerase